MKRDDQNKTEKAESHNPQEKKLDENQTLEFEELEPRVAPGYSWMRS